MTCCLMGHKVECIPLSLTGGAQTQTQTIGVTTILSEYLSEHPQIRFHINKEVLFHKHLYSSIIQFYSMICMCVYIYV